MKLRRNLWFTLAITLTMVCALCACQPKGPDESKVTDLIKQAEDIYHANHNTLPSVEQLLMFQIFMLICLLMKNIHLDLMVQKGLENCH